MLIMTSKTGFYFIVFIFCLIYSLPKGWGFWLRLFYFFIFLIKVPPFGKVEPLAILESIEPSNLDDNEPNVFQYMLDQTYKMEVFLSLFLYFQHSVCFYTLDCLLIHN